MNNFLAILAAVTGINTALHIWHNSTAQKIAGAVDLILQIARGQAVPPSQALLNGLQRSVAAN